MIIWSAVACHRFTHCNSATQTFGEQRLKYLVRRNRESGGKPPHSIGDRA
jgi:hypothetical protein